jgi:two-component system response regulator QseB
MRILLAEVDPMIGAAVERGLRQEGFVVDWVRDGAQAHAALATPLHDVLLLDLGLPRKDGLDVLTAMRRRNDSRPVLVITARDAVTDRVAGLDAGADDYLVKPFDLDELAARIRALGRRTAGRAAPSLRHGDITLDPASREVTRSEHSVRPLPGRQRPPTLRSRSRSGEPPRWPHPRFACASSRGVPGSRRRTRDAAHSGCPTRRYRPTPIDADTCAAGDTRTPAVRRAAAAILR